MCINITEIRPAFLLDCCTFQKLRISQYIVMLMYLSLSYVRLSLTAPTSVNRAKLTNV